MFSNEKIDITDFIKITDAGIKIASFVQIRSALIDRYKSVYGSDIDLSTGTADGVFVNDLALIINNILQSIKTLDSNLNVNSASGIYLDRLCALSNVVRQGATKSKASLKVTNTRNAEVTFDNLSFIDKSGTEWFAENVQETFGPNEVKSITVYCQSTGEVKAPAGWIYQTAQLTYLDVEQEESAIVGSNEETDSQLRARRAQSSGAQGTSVLESLVGALLENVAIQDVYIINNNTTAAISASDGTSIPAHAIYVVLRKRDNINITDADIGTLIQNKLTPGINTTPSSDSTHGTPTSYNYVDDFLSRITTAKATLYWKVAKPVAPTITIKLTALSIFEEREIEEISNTIMSYLNGLQLHTAISINDLLIQTVYADPLFAGKPTYTVKSITADNASGDAEKFITYYNYTKFSKSNVDSEYTITLS